MSKIQWTEQTWNPVTGCSRVSPGCQNCYAEKMAYRIMNMGTKASEYYAGTTRKTRGGKTQWTGRINTVESALAKPLKVKKPTMFFVNSMSDFFHPDIPLEFLMQIWAVIRATPRHTYQILTKRPENILDRLPEDWGEGYPNVWLGVSIEGQGHDHRAETLSQVPAEIRFISAEPLLSPLRFLYASELWDWGIGWVIVGGESGPGARRCEMFWITDLIRDCNAAGVPVFMKQTGSYLAREMGLKDNKGGNMDEWPDGVINCREWPDIASYAYSREVLETRWIEERAQMIDKIKGK